ncbi:Uncharacterised protein [Mycoplasmoides gallisepticum]|uniref:Uncharacterized protein n=1 Tax=Mycoplasmoides gallisepticum TaxID=2096 RepID=A0A3B0PED8_MYCGL|nr:Uncharacterised protein [Mycoplasmoides gallisepticum]
MIVPESESNELAKNKSLIATFLNLAASVNPLKSCKKRRFLFLKTSDKLSLASAVPQISSNGSVSYLNTLPFSSKIPNLKRMNLPDGVIWLLALTLTTSRLLLASK